MNLTDYASKLLENKKRFSYAVFKKKFIYGNRETDGWLKTILMYALLIGIGFVYLYPILFMSVNSIMSAEDVINPTVRWVPTTFHYTNYIVAFQVLDVGKAILTSLMMSALPAIFQTMACAFIGYGFARFEFPLKNMWLVLLVAAFIVPAQVTLVPQYIMFDAYKMLGTPLPSFLPALLGQGIKGSIFVLIFFQFFRSYPKVLDEAAEIDGAGKFKIFFKIALPMSIPAIVVSILFSFVWYWNETYLAGMFFGKAIQTMPMRLQTFVDSYMRLFPDIEGSVENKLNESIRMAGTMLTILPLLILYFSLEKQFVESVDKTGITGE